MNAMFRRGGVDGLLCINLTVLGVTAAAASRLIQKFFFMYLSPVRRIWNARDIEGSLRNKLKIYPH